MDPTTTSRPDDRTARFRATAIRSCGARLVRVVGVVMCPGPGWQLDFVPANGGIVPGSDRIWLTVRETPPATPSNTAIVPVPTEVETLIEDSEASEIAIVRAGEMPIFVPVIDADAPLAAAPQRDRQPTLETAGR